MALEWSRLFHSAPFVHINAIFTHFVRSERPVFFPGWPSVEVKPKTLKIFPQGPMVNFETLVFMVVFPNMFSDGHQLRKRDLQPDPWFNYKYPHMNKYIIIKSASLQNYNHHHHHHHPHLFSSHPEHVFVLINTKASYHVFSAVFFWIWMTIVNQDSHQI